MINSFWDPVRLSLEVAFTAVVLVLIAGTVIGRFMARTTFRGKAALETIFMLPLVLPPSVVGFLLIILFGTQGVIGQAVEWLFQQPIIFTWWAAVLASAVVSFPLMYQSARTGFAQVDSALENAARLDGAGEWHVFWSISLPLSFPSIVTGGILSFARSLGEFGATLMFAGNIPGKTQTIPTAIYIAIETGKTGLAWAWVLCTIGFSFLLLLSIHRYR